MNYKSYRIIGWVIVDETGKIINRNPNKEELDGLEKEPYAGKYQDRRCGRQRYTDEELLDELRLFEKEHGRSPTGEDFDNNPVYPNRKTYDRRFGNWQNALKLVGLDIGSMVRKGILETSQQKARLAEIIIIDHFKQHPIDLAGENKNSSCDGICPNGMIYDVKSSKIFREYGYWIFNIRNKYKEKIEIYYLLAFNEDYSELLHGWRISGWNVIDKNWFKIGLTPRYEFNIKNMKEYDITENIREILREKKIRILQVKVG